jgi:hypothetical protein
MPTIGVSNFYLEHSRRDKGNSYTLLAPNQLCFMVENHWNDRIKSLGQDDYDPKSVLVPLPNKKDSTFFCQPLMRLDPQMKVNAEIVVRQSGEDPYVETFITFEEAERFGYKDLPAEKASVVCYRADFLEENDGKRSTDKEWEIVTLLCGPKEENMLLPPPLTMARNYLQMPGGSFSNYTATDFAQSIYQHSTKGIKVRDRK